MSCDNIWRPGQLQGDGKGFWREQKFCGCYYRVSLRHDKINEVIRRTLGVTRITNKIREVRLRWYGLVTRREDENCMEGNPCGRE